VTSSDEYQWRYRRPAPSVHELFVPKAICRRSQRRQSRRRTFAALLGGLLLLDAATRVVSLAAEPATLPLLPTHIYVDALVPPAATGSFE
jgi:hypothetical protein